MVINIFIQARMSSVRYPGKVLAPFHNKPLINHLIERVRRLSQIHNIVVLTSNEEADEPLVAYLEKIGCDYFRGSHQHVFERFQKGLAAYPCDYFVRLCADSPFLNEKIIAAMLVDVTQAAYDMVSNVLQRTFPQGQSVEIIKSSTFSQIQLSILTPFEAEHVTPYFYQNRKNFKMLSVQQTIDHSGSKTCVDSLSDLQSFISQPPTFHFVPESLCKIEY